MAWFSSPLSDLPEEKPLWQVGPAPRRPFQCPVCLGVGSVAPGFYSRVNVAEWPSSSTSATETCRSCDGKGIVWEPR